MTIAQWPESFGASQLSDFSVSGTLPVKRTEMESGRPRTFRTTKTIMRDAQVSFFFNKVQLGIFWNFFENEGNAGADWFYMPLIVGNTYSQHLVRFKTYPSQSTIKPNKFKITFTVETDQQIIS